MSHSILPPSSAGIWGKPGGCTGWVIMSQSYPELEQSIEAAEGEAAHEIAARVLSMDDAGHTGHPTKGSLIGETATNGTIFTEEMYDSAMVYVEDVWGITKSPLGGTYRVGTEKKVEAPQIHELSWGTTDRYVYHVEANHLHIWDFKHGHESVEAFENWQSLNYLRGIMNKLELGIDTKVTIHISQPRSFHREGPNRTWDVPANEIEDYFKILHVNAHETMGPNARTRSGSHCKHCSARHACPAALTAGMRLFEVVGQPTPIELSPEALSVQYEIVKRALAQITLLETGFKEQIKGLIRGGTAVPGQRFERGYAPPSWTKPVSEIIALGDMLEINLRKPEDVITPTQAKKLKLDDSLLKIYSAKLPAGMSLVSDTNNKAKQVFSK